MNESQDMRCIHLNQAVTRSGLQSQDKRRWTKYLIRLSIKRNKKNSEVCRLLGCYAVWIL
jgi:hypothetical protein